MKKGFVILIIVIAIIAFILGGIVKRYNRLQQMSVGVKSAWAQVENVYQTRYDLVPNLVATVQGAANFEKSTLTAVTEARAKVGGMVNISKDAVNDPQTFAKLQQMQDGLGAALQRLMVVVEKYPDLKANQNFLKLQDELSDTENKIQASRRFYNGNVRDFNTKIQVFPNNVISGMLKFVKYDFFEASGEEKKNVEVKF